MHIATLFRSARVRLDITQHEVARAAGLTRPHVSAIELGKANPTVDVVERIAHVLGLDLVVAAPPPSLIGTRQRDVVHARCSAYVHRRLLALGLECAREVEIAHGRSHGWIDLMAFDRLTGALYVIEVKTSLNDIGAVERQIAWYERVGPDLARVRGWRVRSVRVWLLILATDDVERSIHANRDVLRVAFPIRAPAMRRLLIGDAAAAAQLTRPRQELTSRGLALVDPSSRRRDWLMASRVDGRRGAAPFRDYVDAAVRWQAPTPRAAKPQEAQSA